MHRFGRRALLGEHGGQRHAEAPGEGCPYQLFGVGALPFLEARLVAIGPLKGAGAQGHDPAPLRERAVPVSACTSCGHAALLIVVALARWRPIVVPARRGSSEAWHARDSSLRPTARGPRPGLTRAPASRATRAGGGIMHS